MPDLVLLHWDDRDFWHADMFVGYGDMPAEDFERISPEPDAYLTTRKGAKWQDALERARAKWPDAVFETCGKPPRTRGDEPR